MPMGNNLQVISPSNDLIFLDAYGLSGRQTQAVSPDVVGVLHAMGGQDINRLLCIDGSQQNRPRVTGFGSCRARPFNSVWIFSSSDRKIRWLNPTSGDLSQCLSAVFDERLSFVRPVMTACSGAASWTIPSADPDALQLAFLPGMTSVASVPNVLNVINSELGFARIRPKGQNTGWALHPVPRASPAGRQRR